MGELIQILTPEQQGQKYVDCCWTWVNEPNCVRLPRYRIATPHGQLDFCDEHIDAMLASLPDEWLRQFEHREAVVIGGSDDIPF